MIMTSNQLLAAWDKASIFAGPERGLALLGSQPGAPDLIALSQLSIGTRNARLFEFRRAFFGSELKAVHCCPDCGERSEISLNVDRFCKTVSVPGPIKIVVLGHDIVLRLPTSEDMVFLTKGSFKPPSSWALFRRLLIEPSVEQVREKFEDLGPVLAAMEQGIEKADPLALIELEAECSHCTKRMVQIFDPISFIYSEVDTEARNLLREIHTLAMAYGWEEANLLQMPVKRRRAYIEMVIE